MQEGTCWCPAFEENKGGSFKNLFKTPETRLEVDCDAVNCVYNEDCCCTASGICICGNGACDCEIQDAPLIRQNRKIKK